MAENYWETEEGILERVSLLSDQVRLGGFNNAVKVYAQAVGIKDFTISGDLKATSCAWCQLHVGRTYHLGMFLPELPKHLGCPHFFDFELDPLSVLQ
jgi:hypothetical protein